ncbi:P-loop containing nucleoside triphosphate hydrolase protein [Emericellopsis atlantica]|uniref:P-loop containing nucleoside triphosphate hydrolase protein n=1 Tax=Emericellopsis atlantica TaxID=2614577 RepID=A0A9P7ZLR0_9HYPO|nr:P-loop containing nucleoside triphosphate hydrolase protein [Emericellopsis atlantica]KAG9254027.1 P-loop containing nucleoside triphosphate hydrolase protein [Emericellopsis atlantica]
MKAEAITTQRSLRLQQFFRDALSGNRPIANSRDAGLFLEAIMDQSSPDSTVERVVGSNSGLAAVRLAVRADLSLPFLSSKTLPFLRYLSAPGLKTLANGEILSRALEVIVNPVTLWKTLFGHFEAAELGTEQLHGFIWLACELVANRTMTEEDIHSDLCLIAESPQVKDSEDPTLRQLGYRIKHALDLGGQPQTSIHAQMGGPGGRHDNDHADFRKVRIYPSRDELLAHSPPFYLTADEVQQADTASRAHVHLDNQFRLLREDMLAELRQDLQSVKKPNGNPRRSLVLGDLVAHGMHVGDTGAARFRFQKCSLAVKCFKGLEFLNKKSKEERKKFLNEEHAVLKDQSFGALCHNGEILAFAFISRNVDMLAQSPPVVLLRFTDSQALKSALISLQPGLGLSSNIKFMLVDTPVFAYEPVLDRLQQISEMPLREHLFDDPECVSHVAPASDSLEFRIAQMREMTESIADDQVASWPRKNAADTIKVDQAQLNSILNGLSQAVALIQGPPGTGKSFIGAEIARLLHDLSKQRILVLSYTNHALNQYTEDLLDAGIPPQHVVRLGSRGKCTDRTLPLLLSNMGTGTKLNQSSWANVNSLKSEAGDFAEDIEEAFQRYMGISCGWFELSGYLEFAEEDSEFYDALRTPMRPGEWKKVGKKGKQIGPDYLYNRWISGQDAGIFKDAVQSWPHIWDLPKTTRREHRDRWVRAMLTEVVEGLACLVNMFDSKVAKIETYFREGDVRTVQDKRVMALTTTAAAKHSNLVQSFKPDIIIAEEAGEILESHILTAMTPSVRQLILIGDHKQLRPKVNNYSLSVEGNNGYDLNRSLFERLILLGMPHTVLRKQHRMAPDLSVYARHLTYPELLDAPKTHDREPPRGLCNRVIFVSHDEPESAEERVSDRTDAGSKGSKSNAFEAEMVMRCCKYMGQQGYSSSQIVILTPYLGQLRALMDVLRKNKHDPQMSELDRFELLRAGLLTHAEVKADKQPIRISTIDNYQGEESDIVIASLTRSNSRGDIGFMSAPERLNVLITRARHGMIIFGNMGTFKASKRGKAVWEPFFDMLKTRGCLYDGLPVQCDRHPDRKALVQSAADFTTMCPNGGCTEVCDSLLSCQVHKCKSRCHRVSNHAEVQCNKLVRKTCARGHETRTPCRRQRDGCSKCAEEDAETERQIQRDISLESERLKKQDAYLKELKEIEDELDHQRRAIKYATEEDKRKIVIAQRKKDLAVLQKTQARLQAHKEQQQQQQAASGSGPDTGGLTQQPSENLASYDAETANGEWERMKSVEGAQSAALDTLMGLIGLEEVKKEFISIKTKVDTALRQGVSLSSERLSCSLLGNPGTGKTTVARIYADFLTSIGAIPGAAFEETTGASLANKGVTVCRKMIDSMLEDGGGVVFIDEAYQLSSGHNPGGASVLDFLLAEVENHRGKLAFVLAGYARPMEGFFSHNPGIPSRFPIEMRFADYTDGELLQIFNRGIHKRFNGKMACEDGHQGLYCRIVARRAGYGRDREGFGNARAVENTINVIYKRQVNRLRRERSQGKQPDDFFCTKEDLIGPAPDDILSECPAWKKLQDLWGLQSVKRSVLSLVDSIRENYKRELAEKPRVEYSLNKVFLGNPGTGKTTVVKLYGEILATLGLLSKGEVVVRTPADFIGGALGQSEQQTKGILAAALGKVLVIDEAYGLYDGSGQGGGSSKNPYKTSVIDTIVAEVQSVPGDDRCVLLLGYKDRMESMFQNVNPGLSRRFPLATAFVFDDFSDAELSQILDRKLERQGFRATGQARDVAMDLLARARNRPNFGNAGEIDIILDAAMHRWQARRSQDKSNRANDLLEASDFDEHFHRAESADTNIQKLFEGTVGQDALVARLLGYQATYKSVKALGLDPKESIPFTFLFRGAPGTGKTTVAKKMGKVFYDMGFLATAEVEECSATDLVGQYVGQTGPKVQQMLDRALGRVLFVDEAYRLGEGSFGREALDELVDCLTKARYQKKLIVILAGYEREMNRLMDVNPGLTSRFPEVVDFRDFAPVECCTLLHVLLTKRQKLLAKKGVVFDLEILRNASHALCSAMTRGFETLMQQSSWANARDVTTLAEKIFNRVIQSAAGTEIRHLALEENMVVQELQAMQDERQKRVDWVRQAVPQVDPGRVTPPQSVAERNNEPRTMPATKTTLETTVAPEDDNDQPQETEAEREEDSHVSPADDEGAHSARRDAGVSDAVWAQLQRDREAAVAKEEAYQRLQQEARHARGEEARDRIRRRLVAAEEERQKMRAWQEKLVAHGVCPVGYQWIPQAGGFRCEGGSHFVSRDELEAMFG